MELWTSEHIRTLLPSLAVMLIIGAVLHFVLKDMPLKIRMIPLQILAVIFALPIVAFYNGKHRRKVCGVGAALCASLMLLMLIYPNLIYSGANIREFFTNYFSFHTVAFYNVVMLFFVLIVALQIHTPAPKGEPKVVVLFVVVFCVISATMAQLLKTNYANYYSCNIPPLEAVRVSLQGVLGYGLTQLLYVLIVSALNILFVLGAYWFYRAVRRLCAGKKAACVG